jgi:cobyric acid synthase
VRWTWKRGVGKRPGKVCAEGAGCVGVLVVVVGALEGGGGEVALVGARAEGKEEWRRVVVGVIFSQSQGDSALAKVMARSLLVVCGEEGRLWKGGMVSCWL